VVSQSGLGDEAVVSQSGYRGLIATGVALILLGCVTAIAVPAGLGWDFANFYDAGHKAWAGQIQDLYDATAAIEGAPPLGRMAFWSVPLASYLFVPLAWLQPKHALVAFKIENSLAILAALWLLHTHARRFVRGGPEAQARFSASFVWLALLFQPLWTVFRVGGQTTPTILLLLSVGLLAHTRQRWWLSSFCYVLAVILKPSFVLGLGYLALLSGLPFFLATATWGLGLAACAVLLLGWPIHATFLARMLAGAGISTVWLYNSSLTVVLDNLRSLTDPHTITNSRPPALEAGVQLIRLGVLALFGWLALRARRIKLPERSHALFLLSILFLLLAGPVVWEHYLALLFVPLAYLLAVRQRLARSAQWALAGVFLFSVAQNLVLVLWVNEHLRVHGAAALVAVGLVKSAPLALTLVWLARRGGGLLATYAEPDWYGSGSPAQASAAG